MVDNDGGVVEISLDYGQTWSDIKDYATVDYNTTLDATRGNNVLKGRPAYGNTSAGYPGAWVSSTIAVNLPTHPDAVRVRFRMGTAGDGFAGSPGWEIDDIELGGVATLPFWSFVPSRDNCDPNSPIAHAGENQRTHARYVVRLSGSGDSPSGSALDFHWIQTDGPVVSLQDDQGRSPRFVAPDVQEPVSLSFALRVDDGALLSPPSLVTVLVSPGGSGCALGNAEGAGGAANGVFVLIAALFVLGRRRAGLLR